MSVLKIAKLGHPVLRTQAQEIPFGQIKTPAVQKLISDMKETVIDADGAGLAAPQVHVSQRLVLLSIDEFDEIQVWINPVITHLSDETLITFEGCLSVPGMRGAVARTNHIRVQGYNEHAEPFDFELEDYSSIVAQHECDHLDGIIYVDRVEPGTLSFLEEYKKYRGFLFRMLGEEEEEE
jgi:peptide deformylase